jgi:YD repeat-containing protein
VTTNGAENVDYTYAYNKASQLISTTDPAASDGITYDPQGNALTVGPDSFTYDKANNVISATDGTVTVNYERSFAGAVIAKSTTGGPSAGTIRYSNTGVLLDADSKPYALTYSLDGGVNVTKALTPGAATRWQFTGINGDLFFTTDDAGAVQGSAQAFDPYPFILLNLVLSTLAAIQAPIIMMSQNRQAARDRIQALHDYEVNLKAELEIMALHDKLDRARIEELGDAIRRIEAKLGMSQPPLQ